MKMYLRTCAPGEDSDQPAHLRSPIRILTMCILVSKRYNISSCGQRRLLFYFTAAGVKCCVAAVKRLPVLHHSADYIFVSIWIIETILVTLKIETA